MRRGGKVHGRNGAKLPACARELMARLYDPNWRLSEADRAEALANVERPRDAKQSALPLTVRPA